MSEFTVLKVDDLDTLQAVIDQHHRVVVDFAAPSWCVPCRRLKPHFHAASEKLEGKVLFVEVDIDEAPGVADRYNILSVPTVVLFEGGERVRNVEARTAPALISELE